MSATTEQVIAPTTERPTWTGRFRTRAVGSLPPDKLLPDRQPAYVASWIYIFGALTLAAFGVVLLSGAVLAVEGPSWWHTSNIGLYVNSTHLWSTELFFFFMVIHLWGKFFMAAWRGRRRATWITGVLAFALSIGTAFTGYLSQQNFDSEWIGTQAKDGINATGAGAFWNVLNFGQMLMWHILLLPLIVAVMIGIHVLLVRRRGVVPPFAAAYGAARGTGMSTNSVPTYPVPSNPVPTYSVPTYPVPSNPVTSNPGIPSGTSYAGETGFAVGEGFAGAPMPSPEPIGPATAIPVGTAIPVETSFDLPPAVEIPPPAPMAPSPAPEPGDAVQPDPPPPPAQPAQGSEEAP